MFFSGRDVDAFTDVLTLAVLHLRDRQIGVCFMRQALGAKRWLERQGE